METSTIATSTAALLVRLQQEASIADADLLQLHAACIQLFSFLSEACAEHEDPRIAAAHAGYVEALSRDAARENIIAASRVETTAAHALALDEFDALRDGSTDFTAQPQYAPGRTCYLDAPNFLASWLSITYFEAAARVGNAHLIYRRKDMTGAPCPPLFTHLAGVFEAAASAGSLQGQITAPDLRSTADPRAVVHTARRLAKFEPADTTFEGTPTSPTALDADGVLLDEKAAALLAELDPRTRDKQINTLVARYKKDHEEAKVLPLGLFRGKIVGDTHQYLANVAGLDVEVFESLLAQADNKRTAAGAAARAAAGSQSTADPVADDSIADPLFSSGEPRPDWAFGTSQDSSCDDFPSSEQSAPHPETAAEKSASIAQEPCTVAQRRLNALIAVLTTMDPLAGGKRVTPEIIVHAALSDLRDLATISGVTAHGVKLNAAQLRAMLCEAKVISPIFNGDGVIMDVGRDRRLFTRTMKLAVRERDGGCIVPGCTQDPALIDYHHIEPWEHGGHTSIDNCCPLCVAHHVAVHAGVIKIVMIKKLPYAILPRHLDPEQRPQRNRYFSRS